MAKRTDEQIAEYMRHYSATTDKYQALETLARVEGKTESEIIEICGKYGVNIKSKWGGGHPALTEKKREEVKEAIREGLTLTQVAERCKVGASTAGRIRVEMQNSGEKLPKNVGGHKATAKYKTKEAAKAEKYAKQEADAQCERYKALHPENEQTAEPAEKHEPEERQPEAYPGQIYDDSSEPTVEEDVKVFIPGEQAGTFDAAANSSIDVEKAVNENCEKIREKAQEIDNERIIEVKAKNEALREEIKRQRENTLKIWNALSEPPAPGNPIPFTHSCGDRPCKKQCSGLWFALRDSLSEFLSGTFGAGTELTGESVEPDAERLVIRFRTADGKLMRCTLRAEGKNGK